MEDKEKQKLKNYAIWLLSRQEYSRKLLNDKLLLKGASSDYAEELIDWLSEIGYVDDARHCESFLNRQLAKGLGEKRVLMEATKKGVERTQLLQLIEEKEVDWYAIAQHTYEKKYGYANKELDYQERSKRVRYMMYRGFSYDQIDFAIQAQDEN
ncbi:recombination regulator RecX [Pseudoalteromonas sp. SMS1]|uniref:regulatory protein RecX n=1 Tax=Pseudoalteromonas sp. SMS1 TaxID=2908894 RepID=UPI001F1AE657|nr:regulatory protein RecX [Pseudoalteromonas sp. SMS1]MCF2860445.1 recombination regulator RecX [Pseudoalteromonas sp. SMS1]